MKSFRANCSVVTILYGISILLVTVLAFDVASLGVTSVLNATRLTRTRRSLPSDKINRLRYSKEDLQKMFIEYYNCIVEANKPVNRIHSPITAVLTLEGQSVELICPTCNRPDQEAPYHTMFWQRVRIDDATMTHINPKSPGFKLSEDMKLKIKAMDVTDAGQYFCVKGADIEAIYQVDVVFQEPSTTVLENETDKLLPAERFVQHNIEVYSHWSEWGECDKCNTKAGSRVKYGTCMVQKIYRNKPMTPVDVPIMASYPNGVPCRSTVMPRGVANLPGIAQRKSELLKGSCFKPCPTDPPPIRVYDKDGKLVEVIEGGLHPMGQKPALPGITRRTVLYKASDSRLVLVCPTSQKGRVRWEREDRPINKLTVGHRTKGRVVIDKLNRLLINKVHVHDASFYHCYVWQEHKAAFKLIVYEAMNTDIKKYITYGGVGLIVSVLPLYCICKLCCAKPKRNG